MGIKKKSKKRINRRSVVIVTAILVVSIAAGAYFYYDYNSRVYGTLVVEAGSLVEASDFLKDTSKDVSFVGDTDFDLTTPGDYEVELKSGWYSYEALLEVEDTVAPELELQQLVRTPDNLPTADDFVVSVSDLTAVTVAFYGSPDFTQLGEIPVQIVATDTSGNETVADTTLYLLEEEDTEPPTIEGETSKTVYVGSTISYKSDIEVVDNVDTEPELTVDSSAVDLNTEGEYTVTYTATDFSGNSTTVEGTITVIAVTYTEDEVYALCDEVLDEIITDDMSDYDKAHAIYVWVQGNIGYSESEDRTDWLKAAYDALTNRHGDCYNYFAVSKALLTRAGIKNADIEIIPTATRHHYWNVIDCGEGWRHFDTTPRTDDSFKGFYLTDEELMEYSDAHYHSHNYDRTIYTYFNDETTDSDETTENTTDSE